MRTAATLLGIAMAGAVARAQPPVVVVVESNARQIAPEAVRAALAEAGVRVVSLLDPGADRVERTLNIAVRRDGRAATVQLRGRHALEVRTLRAGRRAPLTAWLVEPILALLRAHRAAPDADVLDPWGGSPAARPPSPPPERTPAERPLVAAEVLDPWNAPGSQPTPGGAPALAVAHVAGEVLDPWSGVESAEAAEADDGARTDDGPIVEILDPWRAARIERAEALAAPHPSRR